MIDINGIFYDWSDATTARIAKRLLSGDELTISKKGATINKYVGSNPEDISINYANMLIGTGILECDSGNFETGERHYKVIEH